MQIGTCRRVLILAPHTDDGELGCGGTIAKLIDNGAEVHYVAFSSANESLPPEFPKDILKTESKRANHVLGIPEEHLKVFDYSVRKLNYVRQEILEELIRLKKKNCFDLIFMPALHDIHQDHMTIAQEGLRAFRYTSILGYELIWNNLSFNTQSFVKLEKQHVEKKALALQEYKSQAGRDYMNPEFIFSLARARGVQIGAEYAEAFEVIRWIID